MLILYMEKEMKNKLLFDKEFRTKIMANPKTVVASVIGDIASEGVSYKVVESTKYITYFVIPNNNQVNLSQLYGSGEFKVGTAGTGGSVGTLGSACTCVGTYSSASSIGSYGSIDSNTEFK